jgi:hypothetical protein
MLISHVQGPICEPGTSSCNYMCKYRDQTVKVQCLTETWVQIFRVSKKGVNLRRLGLEPASARWWSVALATGVGVCL